MAGTDYNTTRTGEPSAKDSRGIAQKVVTLYDDWYERERDNVDLAYEDLRFTRVPGAQWPDAAKRLREEEGRPALEVNKCGQYVRQVTGDIRMSRPAVKVTPVDDSGDQETADVLGGMVRYVENRSDAQAAYALACDAQVTAGVGAWQVITEYAHDETFNQEIGIMPVDDPIAIAWDPDSVLPTREDATWCIVPVDLARETFKKRWPKATAADFDTLPTPQASGWWSEDSIRVATYWCKEPYKKQLALMPDARVVDLTDKKGPEFDQIKAAAERVEERECYKVVRYVVSASEVLEGPSDWPGKYIPVVLVVGEEIKIGRKVHRNGMVRFIKDAQRTFNYAYSTNTEVVAMQPKAPFTGTEKNFEKYQEEWAQANRKNMPYLPYTPDAANNGQPPQRVQPPVSSQGLNELMARATDDMKSVTGIYDASLGARSNETSGRAILARQREGDVSTFVYMDNFSRAVRYTGKILIDLIPKIYDTPRTLRILGEDGKPDRVQINQKVGEEMGPAGVVDLIKNDVTVGAYDVVLETGPSFSTRREEAREGMNAFLQGNQQAAPLVLDLVADAQDWPNAEKIGKRLKTLLPPQIQMMEAAEAGEQPPQIPGQGPDPAQQAEQQAKARQSEAQAVKAEQDARKSGFEADKAEIELQMLLAQLNMPVAPVAPQMGQEPPPAMPGVPPGAEAAPMPPTGPAEALPPDFQAMPPMPNGAGMPQPSSADPMQGQPPTFG